MKMARVLKVVRIETITEVKTSSDVRYLSELLATRDALGHKGADVTAYTSLYIFVDDIVNELESRGFQVEYSVDENDLLTVEIYERELPEELEENVIVKYACKFNIFKYIECLNKRAETLDYLNRMIECWVSEVIELDETIYIDNTTDSIVTSTGLSLYIGWCDVKEVK